MKYLAGAAAVLVACTLVTGTANAAKRYLGNVSTPMPNNKWYTGKYPSRQTIFNEDRKLASDLCHRRWPNTRNISMNNYWTARHLPAIPRGRAEGWVIRSNWNCLT
jgi:hypothetical protein